MTGEYNQAKQTARRPAYKAPICSGWLFEAGVILAVLFAGSFSALGQSTWHTEVVDGGSGADVGKSASMVIERSGAIHIGYYDATGHMLKYAFRSAAGGRWYTMPVPETAHTYQYLSLAVDGQGHPHFAFESADDGLNYAYFDGQSWHRQVIDNIRVAYYNSIQIDPQGHPRISYYQEYSGSPKSSVSESATVLHLKNAFFDGQRWFIQTVDWRTGSGKYNSLAVDANGNAHIAYERIGANELLYANSTGQTWQFTTVDPGATYQHVVGPGASIALGHAGDPHIAYLDITANVVKYASWEGGKWHVQIVDHLAGRTLLEHVSLKMDSKNQAHIAYYDGGTQSLKYAVQSGSGFRVEVADREGNVGESPSLCLDADDRPYIAYYDVDRRVLKLTYRQSSTALPLVTAKNK